MLQVIQQETFGVRWQTFPRNLPSEPSNQISHLIVSKYAVVRDVTNKMIQAIVA